MYQISACSMGMECHSDVKQISAAVDRPARRGASRQRVVHRCRQSLW